MNEIHDNRVFADFHMYPHDLLGMLDDIMLQIENEVYDKYRVDYNELIKKLRDGVNLCNCQGEYYLCNIFPNTEDGYRLTYDDFKEYVYTVKMAYDNHGPFLERNCVDCGKKFTLFKSEIEFYKEKDLSLPKRCIDCRRQRKSIAINMPFSDMKMEDQAL